MTKMTLNRTPVVALVFAAVIAVLAVIQAQPASALVLSGHPGYWAQTSCSEGTETLNIYGWHTESTGGYPTLAGDSDTCGMAGGSLGLRDEGSFDSAPNSGPEWVYESPASSKIVGGVLHVGVKTPHSEAYITTNAFSTPAEWLLDCTTQCANGGHPTVAITQEGGWQLWAGLMCIPPSGESVCPSGLDGELQITNATVMLKNESTPTGTEFGGTLLDGVASGTASLTFTAHDEHGAGVYRVTAELDGQVLWSGTPSLNEGWCVAHGTYNGALNFHSNQPCPQETGVSIEVPTAGIAEGQHQLKVEIEDAAGNTATVYTGTINIDNRPPPAKVVLAPLPPNRGACNGSPCDDAAKLTAITKPPHAFTTTIKKSPVLLAGRLTDSTGAPIKGAQVQLLQQPTSASIPSRIATATTSPDGTWTLHALAGPSRLLQVAYFSHLLDAAPVATLDFHESVRGTVVLHAPRLTRVGHAVVFRGQLAGGYVPPGGESVQMEILYAGRWRTIEVLPTNSRGKWAYKYVFTLGAGASYLFRAVTVPNGVYPFMSAASKPVRVTVQR